MYMYIYVCMYMYICIYKVRRYQLQVDVTRKWIWIDLIESKASHVSFASWPKMFFCSPVFEKVFECY